MKLSEQYKGVISIEELADLHPSVYMLVDIRDEISHNYGNIPGSVCIPDIIDKADHGSLDREKSYVLYCMKGTLSREIRSLWGIIMTM